MIENQKPIGKGSDRALRDYLGFLAWCAPAAVMATFANVILVPRLNKMIEVTKSGVSESAHLEKFTSFYDLLVSNFWFIGLGVTLLLLAGERATKWWPGNRRKILVVIAWLLNFMTMIGLALVGAIALALVPLLTDS